MMANAVWLDQGVEGSTLLSDFHLWISFSSLTATIVEVLHGEFDAILVNHFDLQIDSEVLALRLELEQLPYPTVCWLDRCVDDVKGKRHEYDSLMGFINGCQ